jgi:hypothetical protein
MGFTSEIYRGERIINESSPEGELIIEGMGRGLVLGRGAGEEFAYGGVADPFPADMEIPQGEWQARIQEMEETKSRPSDLIRQAGLPEKNQKSLPYCWIFGPTQCVEVVRMLMGLPYVSLSPASAGAVIKNFRAEGGWGKEGLQFITERGLVPSSLWPDTSLNRSLNTAENWEVAKHYRVTEWYECRPRNLKHLVSLGLRRMVGAGGYNWWGHEVMVVEPVWLDGTVASRIRNQWAGYGDQNFAILQGSRMLPDDLVAPRVVIAA